MLFGLRLVRATKNQSLKLMRNGKEVEMKKYIGLTLLFWTIYIILNSIMDSIIWHSGMFWYQNLTAWHWIKPFAILACGMSFWFGRSLYLHILDVSYAFGWKKTRIGLTIAFFIFYGMLWRWVFFEHFIDKWAGRI